MTNVVVLNSQSHRELRVHPGAAEKFGDNQCFVAVVVNEFPFLVPHYPILLSKDAETGAFYCGAMLGFQTGENLFLDGGGDVYRPLNLRRAPFFTSGSDLAIDLDSPRVNAEGGLALFKEDGEASPYLDSIRGLLRELVPGIERSKVFVETLLQLKLVEPIDINVGFDDGAKLKLEGLYTVNHEALKKLPDAAAIDLFRRGYLYLVYLMLASLKQIPVLAQKRNRRLSQPLTGRPD